MNQEKKNKLDAFFGNAKEELRKALTVDPSGEVTTECFVLLKDLAHCGGEKRSAPISIMPAGTVFRKKTDGQYFSDGFHIIARHIAKSSEEYFLYLTEEEGKNYFGQNNG